MIGWLIAVVYAALLVALVRENIRLREDMDKDDSSPS